ncbi:MAG: hypothetical protein A2269_01940 [Lentisphaerae bacterium RIFOXYA12_FULL_60_10]|nr:MAG: hypothetical protein A2269_01940 [Lentisphaerae bacterium RIFOXYA12_FULL_60_10]
MAFARACATAMKAAMVISSDTNDYEIRVQDLSRVLGCTPAELNTRLLAPLETSLGFQNRHLSPAVVRQVLEASGVSYAFRTIAFINLKGGVGKTTSSLAVASRAVQLGFRTCILDLDAQASATVALGGTAGDDDSPVFQTLWQTPERIGDVLKTVHPFLSYLPSSLENSLLDVSLMNPTAQKNAVSAVTRAMARLGFDLVIIDCPPSLGGAVISTVCAADTIVIPVACDAFSRRGLALTLEEASAIRSTFGLPAPEIRILPTMLDRRSSLTAPVLQQLQAEHGERLLPGGIGTSTLFSRILEKRQTLFSKGIPRTSAHRDYDETVKALLRVNPPAARASTPESEPAFEGAAP